MEKLDVSLGASMASSATSGLQGNFSRIFGDAVAGGGKWPWYVVPAVLGVVVVIAVVWIVRR